MGQKKKVLAHTFFIRVEEELYLSAYSIMDLETMLIPNVGGNMCRAYRCYSQLLQHDRTFTWSVIDCHVKGVVVVG